MTGWIKKRYHYSFILFFYFFKESPSPRANGDHAVDSRDSIGLNGNDKPGGSSSKPSAERPPSRSGSSSSRSTPSLKTKDVSGFLDEKIPFACAVSKYWYNFVLQLEKPGTPGAKARSTTPNAAPAKGAIPPVPVGYPSPYQRLPDPYRPPGDQYGRFDPHSHVRTNGLPLTAPHPAGGKP